MIFCVLFHQSEKIKLTIGLSFHQNETIQFTQNRSQFQYDSQNSLFLAGTQVLCTLVALLLETVIIVTETSDKKVLETSLARTFFTVYSVVILPIQKQRNTNPAETMKLDTLKQLWCILSSHEIRNLWLTRQYYDDYVLPSIQTQQELDDFRKHNDRSILVEMARSDYGQGTRRDYKMSFRNHLLMDCNFLKYLVFHHGHELAWAQVDRGDKRSEMYEPQSTLAGKPYRPSKIRPLAIYEDVHGYKQYFPLDKSRLTPGPNHIGPKLDNLVLYSAMADQVVAGKAAIVPDHGLYSGYAPLRDEFWDYLKKTKIATVGAMMVEVGSENPQQAVSLLEELASRKSGVAIQVEPPGLRPTTMTVYGTFPSRLKLERDLPYNQCVLQFLMEGYELIVKDVQSPIAAIESKRLLGEVAYRDDYSGVDFVRMVQSGLQNAIHIRLTDAEDEVEMLEIVKSLASEGTVAILASVEKLPPKSKGVPLEQALPDLPDSALPYLNEYLNEWREEMKSQRKMWFVQTSLNAQTVISVAGGADLRRVYKDVMASSK